MSAQAKRKWILSGDAMISAFSSFGMETILRTDDVDGLHEDVLPCFDEVAVQWCDLD